MKKHLSFKFPPHFAVKSNETSVSAFTSRRKKVNLRSLLVCSLLVLSSAVASGQRYTPVEEINIRDPFVYADSKTKTYYLYQSTDTIIDGKTRGGVIVWKSKDLKRWQGPRRVFTCPADNYLTGRVWAPEMHVYKGRYYLFLTLNSDVEWKKMSTAKGWANYYHRTVQVMRSKSPDGPFLPITNMPTTPIDQMALDGTLYVEDGVPYLIYCNEWVQRVDGTFRLAQLTPDLSRTIDDGHDLFAASAAPWGVGQQAVTNEGRAYVSDGCFLWKTSKKLLMIFSSFARDGYAVGVAESLTGRIAGPWRVQPETLNHNNGGHGMIFRDFDGRLRLLIHAPNNPGGSERAVFMNLEETPSGDLKVVQ